jgi:hypothetical protein
MKLTVKFHPVTFPHPPKVAKGSAQGVDKQEA